MRAAALSAYHALGVPAVKEGERKMTNWLAVFAGFCLAGSIATTLYTQHLITRCFDILDFCISLAERENDRDMLNAIKKEGTE